MDNNENKPRLSIEHQYNGHLHSVPNYGIWQLTIKEAAELVTLDMWFSGEIPNVEEPEDFDGDSHDPRLRDALIEHTTRLESLLLKAIDAERLEASYIRRGLDDSLIADKTYVEYDDLNVWLSERGYDVGDIFAEWLDTESELAEHICDEVAYLHAVSKRGKSEIRRIAFHSSSVKAGILDEREAADILEAYKLAIAENQLLKEQLRNMLGGVASKVDRPLTTRSRRTMLTIIGSLCNKSGIDYKARGAAQRLREITEETGVPIDDGTISKILSEIQDAYESRMK